MDPSVYRRDGRWYAKVRYPESHPERAGRKSAWRNVPTGETARARALAAAEALQARLDQGLPLRGVTATGAFTVAALCDRFVAEYSRPRLKDVERYRKLAARHLATLVLPHLGQHQVQLLRRVHVAQLAAALRQDGKSERTVQVALARLSTVLTWAMAQETFGVITNCCKGIERGRVEPVNDYLRLPEVQQLLLRDPQRLRPAQALVWTMAVVVLYNGLRLGELRALRWLDVDLEGQVLRVEWSWREGQRPKSGKARELPLHPALPQILRVWRERCTTPEGLVFPVADGDEATEHSHSSVRGLRRLCKDLGVRVLKPRPWHGLRHTFSRHLDVATSNNTVVVAALLGHARQGAAATLAYLGDQDKEYLARELAKLTYR